MNRTENRNLNRDRLLSLVQNGEFGLSPRPLLYDLREFGGVNILISRKIYTDEELREIARKDKQEDDELKEKFRLRNETQGL